jgi:uncharacterized protein (DUF111 family)
LSEPGAVELQLEIVGPMTGDMFVAALLDTFPDYEDVVLEAIEATCERYPVECRLEFRHEHDLRGHCFVIEPYTRYFGNLAVQPVDEREAWSTLQAELASASLPAGVVRHANGILTLLARHQGTRQDLALDAVTFPKDDAWLMLAQIVGASVIIDGLGAARWTASLSGTYAAAAVGRGILAYLGALPEQGPVDRGRVKRSILLSGVGFAAESGESEHRYVRINCLDTLNAVSSGRSNPTLPPAGNQHSNHKAP